MSRKITQQALALAVAALVAACGGESDKSLVQSAQAYIDKGDHKAATLQLKSALQKNGTNGEARYLLGTTLMATGNAVAAEVEFRKARELKYDDAKVAPALARTMLALGQSRKIIDDLGSLSFDNPKATADLKTTLAAAHAVQGDKERANDLLAQAQQAVPLFPPALMAKARLKAADNDIDGAIFLVDEVLSREKEHLEALMFKGELLAYGKKDPKAAVEAWRALVAKQPDAVGAHSAIISALVESNDLPGATAQLEALMKAQPNHSQTKFHEAQIAFIGKDFKRSRELIDLVLKVRPDDPFALQLAGVADFQLKSLTTAENFLARALKTQPNLTLARETLAQIYLRSKQPNKAVDLLAPMVGVANPDPRHLAMAAEAYRQSGDAKRADELFARAAKADPGNTGVRAAAALNQAAKGDEKALGELEALAAADTKSNRTDIALIRARLEKKDLDGALKAIDALQKKQPDKPLAYQLRGRVLLLKKDEKGAIAAFEKALSLDAKFTPAAASLAALDLRAGKPDAAKKRLDDVLAADPKNLQAMVAMADLKLRTGGTKDEVAKLLTQAIQTHPGEARVRLLLVNHLLTNDDPKAALNVARDASAALPESMEVMDVLGVALLRNGDQQQAVSTFKKLAALQPTQPLPQMRLGDAYLSSRDRDGATQAFKRALEIKPDLLAAQRALVDLAIADRKPQDAITVARTVQKQRPAEGIGFMLEGDAEASRKNWESALLQWRAALAKSKVTEVASRVHRGLVETGKAPEAERFAASWMAENPKDALFLFQLGDQALGRKQWAQAEAHYLAVLKVQPDYALAHNNVAWLLMQQSKPGALAHAEKANSLLPDRAPLMDTLALALLAEGQAPKALEVQKRALERAPDSPLLRLTLARIYVKTGAKDQAKTELEKLARLGEKFPQQAEVAELLKAI